MVAGLLEGEEEILSGQETIEDSIPDTTRTHCWRVLRRLLIGSAR